MKLCASLIFHVEPLHCIRVNRIKTYEVKIGVKNKSILGYRNHK